MSKERVEQPSEQRKTMLVVVDNALGDDDAFFVDQEGVHDEIAAC
jgi:hypothetical protein